ncbi:MAG: hypothetical protein QM676_06915, partial [Novosphingobium sp.]
SSHAPTAEQQRITQLEQEKAQLEAQLKDARNNIAKLQAALGHGGYNDDAESESSGPVMPQPVDPGPQNGAGISNNPGGGADNAKPIG